MRHHLGTHLRVGLIGVLALFGAACQDQDPPLATETSADLARSPVEEGVYAAELTPLNNSGVRGAAAFIIEGGMVTARVHATGLVPNRLHPQHVYALGGNQNSVCPAPSAANRIPNSPMEAADPDRYISVEEGLPDYGPIRVPLDGELNTTAEPMTFPTANAEGVVDYRQSTAVGPLLEALRPFELRPGHLVVVLHGAFVTGPGGEEVYVASLPVACGQVRRVKSRDNVLVVPPGFRAEKVVDGLNFPTSVVWDDQGRMFVAEAGGGLIPQRIAPIRIVRVENGQASEVVDLTGTGVNLALVGMTWHNGAFYIAHRADDRTGAVSRVTPDGQVTQILSGIIDSQSEHQVNDVKIGPDGRMYLAVGRAANSAVVGPDIAPFVMLSPGLHARPCQDIVLRGHNFLTADFRTEAQGDSVLTGAFVPFGTATQPGQRIPGVTKCGGSILVFDPANAEATLQVHASGFRQPIGLAWNRQTGEMFVGENGPDVRGPRPVRDEFDATLRVQAGHWYGWPDYSSAREPLTLDKFDVPDSLQAPIFRGTQERLGRFLDFVIDHEASGLTPPNRSLVLGLHPYQSSPSFLDVAPASWGGLAGQLFVAEWGDLRPNTNPLAPREQVAGFRIVRVDPNRSQAPVEAFIQNRLPGPASEQGARGQGLERPFDVKFGPDGAMYIVDFGEVEVLANQMPPYNQRPGTGAIWRIVRTGM